MTFRKKDFIKERLIEKIKEEIGKKQDSINFNSFFYFNDLIIENSRVINRVNLECAYSRDSTYPYGFWTLSGKTLLKIFNSLKLNQIHFYKLNRENNKFEKTTFNG